MLTTDSILSWSTKMSLMKHNLLRVVKNISSRRSTSTLRFAAKNKSHGFPSRVFYDNAVSGLYLYLLLYISFFLKSPHLSLNVGVFRNILKSPTAACFFLRIEKSCNMLWFTCDIETGVCCKIGGI